MVRGSVLFIALVISFLVASITSGIIYYSFYYNIQVSDQYLYRKLARNLESGIAYVLSMPESEQSLNVPLDLYGEGEDSILVSSRSWGVYNMASVVASHRGKLLQKSFMYGYLPAKESIMALHLADSDRGLRIGGRTFITGDCYLPQGVVKTATVDGYLYQGPKELIAGKVYKSTTDKVPLNEEVLSRLKALLKDDHSLKNSDAISSAEEWGDTLSRSFSDSTLYVDYRDERLEAVHFLEGNILVYSEKPIAWRRSLRAKDILLVAPSVVFPESYEGSLQAVCSDSILLEADVKLHYPSALVLLKSNIANASPKIELKERVIFKGVLFAYSELVNDEKIYIRLAKESVVTGQAFSSGSIDAQGTVYGGLICRSILLKTNTSINENYLLNATVNVRKRSEHYTGSNLLPSGNRKNIIKYF